MKLPFLQVHVMKTGTFVGRIKQVITAKDRVIDEVEARAAEQNRMNAREIASLLGRVIELERVLARYNIRVEGKTILKP